MSATRWRRETAQFLGKDAFPRLSRARVSTEVLQELSLPRPEDPWGISGTIVKVVLLVDSLMLAALIIIRLIWQLSSIASKGAEDGALISQGQAQTPPLGDAARDTSNDIYRPALLAAFLVIWFPFVRTAAEILARLGTEALAKGSRSKPGSPTKETKQVKWATE